MDKLHQACVCVCVCVCACVCVRVCVCVCVWEKNKASHLFVHFGPAFDLSHNHSHDASSEGGSEGEELLVGGDVLIPWVWVPRVTGQTDQQESMSSMHRNPKKLSNEMGHFIIKGKQIP